MDAISALKMKLHINGIVILCSTVVALVKASTQQDKHMMFHELKASHNGPVTFTFMTPTSIVISERTSLALLDLEKEISTELMGSKMSGGYVDGNPQDARFSLINDVVVQGKNIYIADYGCVRVYDTFRKLVGTLVGICGRMDEADVPTTSLFSGHLKLAVTARELYVLDSSKIFRVDVETGVAWILSGSDHLANGQTTSIDVDPFTNQLFVTVMDSGVISVITVNTASGQQQIHAKINARATDKAVAQINVASLDVGPDGSIYILQQASLYILDTQGHVTTSTLDSFGYHEIAVSTKYLVLSQEYYSRMYKLRVAHLEKTEVKSNSSAVLRNIQVQSADTTSVFERGTFYVAIILPGALLLLVVITSVYITRKVLRERLLKRMLKSNITTVDKLCLNGDESWM